MRVSDSDLAKPNPLPFFLLSILHIAQQLANGSYDQLLSSFGEFCHKFSDYTLNSFKVIF